MKKKHLFLIALLIFLNGCTILNERKYLSKKLDLNLDNCKIKSEDTHGGFLGDGTYFAKITCEKVDSKVNDWTKLPYRDDIKEALDLDICDEKSCKTVFERYNIPEIQEGTYYFIDRQEAEGDLNSRSSYNFSIAIYDNNKTIYFYEFDT